MKNNKKYNILSLSLLIIAITTIAVIDKSNNIRLSFVIQILLILYLLKITYGCILYIKEQYKKQKYSYSIVMNLGLVIFLVINILRQINLLVVNWNLTSINDIYTNTLESFTFFSYMVLPFILILTIYSIIANIVLIKKEGFKFTNLLGILFGVAIILVNLSNQLIYEFAKNIQLDYSQLFIKKFADIGINAFLCYMYCIILATLYCNIMASRHNPEYDKDFIIILGSKIKNDGTLTPLLKGRVDSAIKFAKNQMEKTNKQVIFVPSGGKGYDEIISEADAMKNYLLENNISENNIIVENNSKNTVQNIKYSKEKIDDVNSEGKIIFSTTSYHVFRSGVIPNNEGVDCEGISSPTKWYFYANALVREFIASLVSQKFKHLFIILSIDLSLLILIIIGYQYKLITF